MSSPRVGVTPPSLRAEPVYAPSPMERRGTTTAKVPPEAAGPRVLRRGTAVTAVLLAVLGWVLLPAARADDDPATAATRASLERIRQQRHERPGDGLLAYYESIFRLRLGERDAALELLRGLAGRRLGIVPVRDVGFDELWDDPEFRAIRARLAAEEERTPASPVVFRLGDPKLIPEGIAYDPEGARFFLGSIAQRKIVVTSATGQGTRDFSRPDDRLDPVLGLTVDAGGRHLYAVTTNGFEDAARTRRRNAVVRYDLKSGRLVDRWDAPEALQLNDLAVAADGTVYATDSIGGRLFRRSPGKDALTPFGAAGTLRGANGIALSPQGDLYVAISTGIARVDTVTGEAVRVPQPDTVVTGGCDGLYWFRGDLIGVQNVTNPGRVVRIVLADKGTRVEGLQVLQSSHHPEFDEPTTGALARDVLYVIANSHVGHSQPDGTIRDPDELRGTAIVAVPLRQAR